MNEPNKRTVVREQDPEVAAIRKIRGAIDGLSTSQETDAPPEKEPRCDCGGPFHSSACFRAPKEPPATTCGTEPWIPDPPQVSQVMAPAGQPKDVIDDLFTYHKATPEQEIAYLNIRSEAKALVRVIDAYCPPGPDRTTAVRKIREAVMTANASIATGNAQYR